MLGITNLSYLLGVSLFLLLNGGTSLPSIGILLVLTLLHLYLSSLYGSRKTNYSRLALLLNVIIDASYASFLLTLFPDSSSTSSSLILSSFRLVSLTYILLRGATSIFLSGHIRQSRHNHIKPSMHYTFATEAEKLQFSQKQLKIGILSLLTYSFLVISLVYANLAGMNKELTLLPFKLTGLLNYFIWDGLPFIYAIPYINLVRAQCPGQYVYIYLSATTIASLMSSVALGSRGYIINVLLVYLVGIQLAALRPSARKKYINILARFIILSGFCAIFLTLLRNTSDDGGTIDILRLTELNVSPTFFLTLASQLLGRGLSLFTTLYKYINENVGSIDIANISEYGGFARYHTQAIDGFPVGALHSSGSSTFADSYLILGSIGILLSTLVAILGTLLLSRIQTIFRLRSQTYVLYLQFTFLSFFLSSSFWELLLYRPAHASFIIIFGFYLEKISRRAFRNA